MNANGNNKFRTFVGIDISKNKLDWCVIHRDAVILQKTISNQPEHISAILGELKKIPGLRFSNTVFCMEAIGLYGNHLVKTLTKARGQLIIENPLHIKMSMGLVRDKNDEKDALRIAWYVRRHIDQCRLFQPERPVITRLRHLISIRDRMVVITGMLKTPLKEQAAFASEKLKKDNDKYAGHLLHTAQNDIKKIEQITQKLIKEDARLHRLVELITSVPGIGKHTAVYFLISTNEFKTYCEARTFACYAGVVPFRRQSGQFRSSGRVSHIGNKKMKKLLFLCACWAIRIDPELKDYYMRKTTVENKAKLSALNAIKNKLIKRVFACVRDDRVFVRRDIPTNECGDV